MNNRQCLPQVITNILYTYPWFHYLCPNIKQKRKSGMYIIGIQGGRIYLKKIVHRFIPCPIYLYYLEVFINNPTLVDAYIMSLYFVENGDHNPSFALLARTHTHTQRHIWSSGKDQNSKGWEKYLQCITLEACFLRRPSIG